jgi:hypothetical protein
MCVVKLNTSARHLDWHLYTSTRLSTSTFIDCRIQWKKLKLSHYMPWRHLGGEDVQLLLILDLGTRWGWVVSVTPWPRFSPGERTPSTHCTGGWVGPRAGLDKETVGKILCPCQGSNPNCPVVQPIARHYTAWANSAHRIQWKYKENGKKSILIQNWNVYSVLHWIIIAFPE